MTKPCTLAEYPYIIGVFIFCVIVCVANTEYISSNISFCWQYCFGNGSESEISYEARDRVLEIAGDNNVDNEEI